MPKKFSHPGHHVDMLDVQGRRVGTMTIGGPFLRLVTSSGREVLFEMHAWFGPHPVSKKTRDPLDRIPAGFWNAIERWELGGSLVDGDRCVVPQWCGNCDGIGRETLCIDRLNRVDLGPCKACNGTRIIVDKDQPRPAASSQSD
jgi:hypothetical protein